ncbi:hypothetical protein RRG08_044200 [Elysia crispata]|uniref:Uncharacterized protein n=1 Tax=Elysia crispata TaxID=231223 RepID=A0AAE0XWU0_9GAST|nr:hypothetical protein RRG08_044200 [Elysia crispata]
MVGYSLRASQNPFRGQPRPAGRMFTTPDIDNDSLQPQMQQSSNVVVVNNQQGGGTVVVQKRGVNHCLHCCISLFFFPWIIVWIILCITD